MYNEVFNKKIPRKAYQDIISWANSLPYNTLIKKKAEAENLFKKIGITFSVYNNFDSSERLIPFDMFPRIITKLEWLEIYVRVGCGYDFSFTPMIKGVKSNYNGEEFMSKELVVQAQSSQ